MEKEFAYTMFRLLPCSRKEAGTALTNILHETSADKKKSVARLDEIS